MSHKGFDTSIGSRFDAQLMDMLGALMAPAVPLPEPVPQLIRQSIGGTSSLPPTRAQPGTLGSLRRSRVGPLAKDELKLADQRVTAQAVPVVVPPTRPGYRPIHMAITPARPLRAHLFAGGLDWHATQKTEE